MGSRTLQKMMRAFGENVMPVAMAQARENAQRERDARMMELEEKKYQRAKTDAAAARDEQRTYNESQRDEARTYAQGKLDEQRQYQEGLRDEARQWALDNPKDKDYTGQIANMAQRIQDNSQKAYDKAMSDPITAKMAAEGKITIPDPITPEAAMEQARSYFPEASAPTDPVATADPDESQFAGGPPLLAYEEVAEELSKFDNDDQKLAQIQKTLANPRLAPQYRKAFEAELEALGAGSQPEPTAVPEPSEPRERMGSTVTSEDATAIQNSLIEKAVDESDKSRIQALEDLLTNPRFEAMVPLIQSKISNSKKRRTRRGRRKNK